jgi:hypothetical protein
MGARLPDGAGHDAAGRGAAVCVFQMEEVVVEIYEALLNGPAGLVVGQGIQDG